MRRKSLLYRAIGRHSLEGEEFRGDEKNGDKAGGKEEGECGRVERVEERAGDTRHDEKERMQ